MKPSILSAFAGMMLLATSACAQTYVDPYTERVLVEVTNSRAIYGAGPIYTETVCELVDVPVQGYVTGTPADAIAGAIIGGVIGNQFGNGDGKDVMTVLGAITGAQAGGTRRATVGYRQEQRCREVYAQTGTTEIIGFIVSARGANDNRYYEFASNEPFYPGYTTFIDIRP